MSEQDKPHILLIDDEDAIGVEALRRVVPGVPRRQVRAIKKRVCREMVQ